MIFGVPLDDVLRAAMATAIPMPLMRRDRTKQRSHGYKHRNTPPAAATRAGHRAEPFSQESAHQPIRSPPGTEKRGSRYPPSGSLNGDCFLMNLKAKKSRSFDLDQVEDADATVDVVRACKLIVRLIVKAVLRDSAAGNPATSGDSWTEAVPEPTNGIEPAQMAAAGLL